MTTKTIENCFIDGQWIKGQGDLLKSTNPANNQIVWQANQATETDVDKAFKAAHKAFKSWSKTTLADRLAIIEKYKLLLEKNKEQLAHDIMIDTGKPLWESRTEATTMIGKVDLSIKSYHERTPTISQGEGDKRLLTHRPHGVCAVFGPYNFPGHLPNGHIVPALIAGNTIVFKPSEQTPTVGARIIDLLAQAGIPKGVVNFVPGLIDTAKAITAHNLLDGFFFTGSSTVGKLIHQQFAGRPEVVLALEMGGNNPLIVLDDVLADEDKLSVAVQYTLQSAFVTAGQRCTCARRLIIPKGQLGDAFLTKLIEATKHIHIDSPISDDNPFYSMVVSNQTADALLAAQKKLINLDGISLLEMKRLSEDTPVISPAIIDMTYATNIPDEEYFGPILKVHRADSFDHAIEIANDTSFGLSAGIFTENTNNWNAFYQQSHAGIVNWNKPLTGASGAAPFGGTGGSGNHRPSAFYAADYCAYPVASVANEKLV